MGPLGDILMAQLSEHDYTDVRIVDVEVPASIAHEQAVRRWWEGRLLGISGQDRMGGRFTPPAAIARLYEKGSVSRCATHARAAFESSLAAAITQVTLIHIDRRLGAEPLVSRRVDGKLVEGR